MSRDPRSPDYITPEERAEDDWQQEDAAEAIRQSEDVWRDESATERESHE